MADEQSRPPFSRKSPIAAVEPVGSVARLCCMNVVPRRGSPRIAEDLEAALGQIQEMDLGPQPRRRTF